MSSLFRFPSAMPRDPAIEAWMRAHAVNAPVLEALVRAADADMRARLKAARQDAGR
jgi:hypothetical protein